MTDRYLCQSGIPAPRCALHRQEPSFVVGYALEGLDRSRDAVHHLRTVCRHATCRLATLFQAILGYPKAALTGPAADICMQNGTVSPIFERFKHRRSPKPSIQARNQDRQDIFEAFHGLTVHMRSAESPFIKRG